jgi:ribonuclease D
VLVEIARKAPTTLEGLRGLRAVRSRELERHADDVLQRIARALETPKEEWPQPSAPQGAAPSTGVVELLQAVLRLRAEEAGIASSLLATSADLQVLVQRHAAGDVHDVPIMQGWRKTIAGADLLALLEGRASVALDPASGAVRVSQRRGDAH